MRQDGAKVAIEERQDGAKVAIEERQYGVIFRR